MRIYDYLFYKGYELARWSKRGNDAPMFGGVMAVAVCLLGNIVTIALVFEGFGINTGILWFLDLPRYHIYTVLVATGVTLLLIFHYKVRYERIVERYEEKERAAKMAGRKPTLPIVVVALSVVISFGLVLMASLWNNRDWIFSQIPPM